MTPYNSGRLLQVASDVLESLQFCFFGALGEGFPELRQLSSPLTSVDGACTALSNRFIQSCDSDCLNILGLHHLLVKIDSGILQNC